MNNPKHHQKFSRNRGVKRIVDKISASSVQDEESVLKIHEKQKIPGLEDFFESTKNY